MNCKFPPRLGPRKWAANSMMLDTECIQIGVFTTSFFYNIFRIRAKEHHWEILVGSLEGKKRAKYAEAI